MDDRPREDDTSEIREALAARPAPTRRRSVLRGLSQAVSALLTLGLLVWGVFWLLLDPDTPLAPEWNPTEPLDLSRPATPLTGFKLRRAEASGATCMAALETGAGFEPMTAFEAEGACGIPDRVRLTAVGPAAMRPVETACATALRLAAWQRHAVTEAADILGSPVVGLSHQGSYNCRAIRGGTRLSSHATASAIDINGVVLADGRRIALLGNWDGDGPEARFWRMLRDGGCAWFSTVLGPDFDANHADHLHLQVGGWGTCR